MSDEGWGWGSSFFKPVFQESKPDSSNVFEPIDFRSCGGGSNFYSNNSPQNFHSQTPATSSFYSPSPTSNAFSGGWNSPNKQSNNFYSASSNQNNFYSSGSLGDPLGMGHHSARDYLRRRQELASWNDWRSSDTSWTYSNMSDRLNRQDQWNALHRPASQSFGYNSSSSHFASSWGSSSSSKSSGAYSPLRNKPWGWDVS